MQKTDKQSVAVMSCINFNVKNVTNYTMYLINEHETLNSLKNC